MSIASSRIPSFLKSSQPLETFIEHSELAGSWCLQSTLWEILKIATRRVTRREPSGLASPSLGWLSLSSPVSFGPELFVDVKYTELHFLSLILVHGCLLAFQL